MLTTAAYDSQPWGCVIRLWRAHPACITPMHLREQSRRRARRAVEPIMAASPGKGSRTILVHSTARNSIIFHHYAPYPASATPTPNPFPFDTCNGVSHDGCTLASSRKRHANALTHVVPPPRLAQPSPPPHARSPRGRRGGGGGGVEAAPSSDQPRSLLLPAPLPASASTAGASCGVSPSASASAGFDASEETRASR